MEALVRTGRCPSCFDTNPTGYWLCPRCVVESARTSHRLDGHSGQPIFGCPPCDALELEQMSGEDFKRRLGLYG